MATFQDIIYCMHENGQLYFNHEPHQSFSGSSRRIRGLSPNFWIISSYTSHLGCLDERDKSCDQMQLPLASRLSYPVVETCLHSPDRKFALHCHMLVQPRYILRDYLQHSSTCFVDSFDFFLWIMLVCRRTLLQ